MARILTIRSGINPRGQALRPSPQASATWVSRMTTSRMPLSGSSMMRSTPIVRKRCVRVSPTATLSREPGEAHLMSNQGDEGVRPSERADTLPVETRERRGDARLILVMRGLRSLAYGLLAVILGVWLWGGGFSPAAIGVLITVSLIGDMVGTYVIGLVADTWGRRRILALLSLLMTATGVIFGLVTSYPVLLVAAFFGTLGTSASETAPFLPIDQAMLAQITPSPRRTALFARYNLVAQLSAALGALAAGLPALLVGAGLSPASGTRLLFGAYTVLGLVVAGLSLRLSSPLDAP